MSRASRPLGAGVVINVVIIGLGLAGIAILLIGGMFQGEGTGSALGDTGLAPQATGSAPGATGSAPAPLAIRLETVATGLEAPVLLTGTGDGSGDRLVVEQRGTVRRLGPDGQLADDLFLDIRDRVLHHQERGLLGLALHPDFAQNGRFFVLYIRAGDGATVISEFRRAPGDEADPSEPSALAERALLTIPASSTLHKGGMLAFDREGLLLAGIGDGSTGNDPEGVAQDRASLLGKILRVDVDGRVPYGLPADNGFAGVSGARPEVHALGLRNPWRFSLDPVTGHAYIGDVGQGAWEEVDVLAPGTREPSFGWSTLEGPDCFAQDPCDGAAHIPPAIAYAHDADGGHCGVIGGYVYRGEGGSLPAGTYVYGDFCSGTLWAVPAAQLRDGDAVPVVAAVLSPEMGRIRSFGQDDAGELYLLTSEGLVLGIAADAPGDASAGS